MANTCLIKVMAMFLAFDGKQVAISRQSPSVDELRQCAELKFSLVPASFDLFDACGKVETDVALSRSKLMMKGGNLVLEVRERPEWRKMREMDAQIKLLAGNSTNQDKRIAHLVEEACQSIEKRLLQRVEASLQKLQPGTVSGLPSDELGACMNDLKQQLANLEAQMTEDSITSSCLHSQVNANLKLIREELTVLRPLKDKVDVMETKFTEQSELTSALNGHVEKSLSIIREELEILRPLSDKMETLEIEMNEHVLSSSFLNGHLEQAVGTAKKELQTVCECMTERFGEIMQSETDLRSELQTVHAMVLQAQGATRELQAASNMKRSQALVPPELPTLETPSVEQIWVRKLTDSQKSMSNRSPCQVDFSYGSLPWSDGVCTYNLPIYSNKLSADPLKRSGLQVPAPVRQLFGQGIATQPLRPLCSSKSLPQLSL